jgi:hypothetical protein
MEVHEKFREYSGGPSRIYAPSRAVGKVPSVYFHYGLLDPSLILDPPPGLSTTFSNFHKP